MTKLGLGRLLAVALMIGGVWLGEARPVRADDISEGLRLFTEETFGGNGRTCATCHVLALNGRLPPSNVAARFATLATTFDPLFIAEPNMNLNTLTLASAASFANGAILTGPGVGGGTARAKVLTQVSANVYLVYGGIAPAFTPGNTVSDGVSTATVGSIVAGDLDQLESPAKMRGPSVSPSFPQGRGLILVNPDGFGQPPVFRKSPHMQNLGETAPYGFDNVDGLEGFTTLAVRQHFSRRMARVEGVDFRLPTELELSQMRAFLVSMGTVPGFDFNLDNFARTSAQRRGRTVFGASCSGCHFNQVLGSRGEDPFKFATGISNQAINGPAPGGDNLPRELPDDPVLGSLRPIAVPGLFNVKNNAPFFHDNSAATLEDVVNFYRSATFTNSPDGFAVSTTAAEVPDLVAFLGSLVTRNYTVEAFGGVDVTRKETSLAFGQVATNVAVSRALTVRNTSAVPVTFASPACTMVGPTDFSAVCTSLNGATLAPAETRSIAVIFDPASVGSKTALLELATDDPTGVDITGEGVDPTGVTDSFSTDSSGPPPGWQMIRGGSFSVSGGQLRMTKCTGCIAPNGSILVNDFVLPARFVYTIKGIATSDSNDSNDFAVIFNFQDVNNYYYASFNERLDKAGLFKMLNGTKYLLSSFPAATPPGGQTAALKSVRIEKTDNHIRVLLGTTVYADVNNGHHTGGRAGVGSLNDSGRFDDFSVVEVP